MATPSLRQLDIFAQMVASGSLSRCAGDLGVTPDDVARDLASLELRLGYRLFDDLAGAPRLTAAGRKTAEAMTLLSQDRPENWQVDQADGIVPAAAPPESSSSRQSIVLAAPAPVFGHFQEALAAFEAANDDVAITLDLTIHLADEAAWALRRGKADIAYFYALGETDEPLSRYGWSEQINLYAGADHPLARRDSVATGELAAMPTLAMEAHNGLRRIIDEALLRGGIRLGDPVLETDNLFDIMTILREGAGCFAAFGPLARDLGRMTGIRRIALERPLPAIEVRQALRPESAPAAAALAEFLFL
ncbi:LysR family transcriptional regulator [Sphingobium indicum]|uniref:LysR family transcriptional regulator n=2 Tax=Sphingobium indicum TaxID=332055 RepID=A0A1L5BR20_SPHIB|nr:LysR family transcriptional regulator [Sphingobium indicum]APL95316.1 LysR family transcriptional regulator [Sphingobium indicum B90A]NYI22415.1 DNA-binding transcriptional LysR family regulator [Sphingobium indicum]RYM02587.1 LysR family transcriptional regulator [Sphingobium indicum]